MGTPTGERTERSKKKIVLQIPLQFNDGSAIPTEVLLTIYDRLYSLCGGWTEAGKVKGAYRMATGQKQVDECLQVWVAVAPSDMDELRDLVRQFGRELGQESMYFEITGSEVEFIS